MDFQYRPSQAFQIGQGRSQTYQEANIIKLLIILCHYLQISILFRMIQFLQEEIECRKQFKHKALHEQTVRDDLNTHHQQLQDMLIAKKEALALEELDVQQEKDELLLEKLRRVREIQDKQKQLNMVLLEKSRMMRECELNQVKLRKNREQQAALQTKYKAANHQKEKLVRQIRENQVICERARLENQDLRKRCEQQMKTVTSETVNKQTSKSENMIRRVIEDNMTFLSKLINLSESDRQNCRRLYKQGQQADNLRVIQLTRQLESQNAENFMLKGHLKCEEIKYFQLSSKFDVLSKAALIRSTLTDTFSQQQQDLYVQISQEKAKREELQSKLAQYKRLRKQLQEMYGKLTTNYDSCKYSDLHGIKQMNKTSHRLERNITQQRHFLVERYSIVDSYRKYLRNN